MSAIELLEKYDDAYYNGEPLIPDAEYDILYQLTKQEYPNDPYFTRVGAKVHGEEVKHDVPVAGLKQLFDQKDLTNWVKHNASYLISEKLDGSSGTLTYVNGKLKVAATRGDGFYGKDFTRHALKIPSIPKSIKTTKEVINIRGEIIISKKNWPLLQQVLLKVKGREYKNARNTVVGLINSKEIPEEALEYIDFVAYDIAGSEWSKENQFLNLGKMGYGFETANHLLSPIKELNEEKLNGFLALLKEESEYECDGIVVDINEPDIRSELMPTESDLNPGYAFKWKANSEDNTAIGNVIGLEWNVSKHGLLKPVVLIEPVDLQGITVKRLTGFNMSFITNNMISTGAKVKFARSGDVIPHILEVIEKATVLDLPEEEWEWNETRVDALMVEETERSKILKIKSFFDGFEIDQMGEASIEKLYEVGMTSIPTILKMEVTNFESILGKNGIKAYNHIKEVFSNCDLATLIGSWPYFGRGFGVRKAKAMLDTVSDWRTCALEDLLQVEGYSDKTANLFLNGRDNFIDFLDDMIQFNHIKLKEKEEKIEGVLSGQSFAFTGIRSKEAEEIIIAQGGEVHDGVKKNTTYLVAKDPLASSGKLDKARKQGTSVISLIELFNILG